MVDDAEAHERLCRAEAALIHLMESLDGTLEAWAKDTLRYAFGVVAGSSTAEADASITRAWELVTAVSARYRAGPEVERPSALVA